MVLLFQGLCAAAGLMAVKPVRAASASGAPSPRQPVRPAQKRASPEPKDPVRHNSVKTSLGSMPAPLAGLLQSLPPEGEGWTKDQRARFLTTFTAVLDFCFPVVTNIKDSGGSGEAAA